MLDSKIAKESDVMIIYHEYVQSFVAVTVLVPGCLRQCNSCGQSAIRMKILVNQECLCQFLAHSGLAITIVALILGEFGEYLYVVFN